MDIWRRSRRKKEARRPPASPETGRRRAPTPIYVSRRVFTALVVLMLLSVGLILYLAPIIFEVLFGGIALALVLSYPVRALSQVMPRELAILVTVVGLFVLVALALLFLVPLLIEQLTNFVRITPAIAASAAEFFGSLDDILNRRDLPLQLPESFVSDLVRDLFDRAQQLLEGMIRNLIGFISGAFSFAVGVLGVLFVAIYLLIDVRKVKAAYLRMIPHRYRWDARELWDAFGVSLSRYLGGLLFVVVVQGALSAAALWVLGVPYPLLLGAWVSLTAIIPYLGPFLGAIPAIIVALIFTTPTTAVLTVIAYIAIQQFEGNFLTPRIQGRALQVHPIIVLLAVIGGGQIAGIVGILFAVPVLAILRVFVDFFRVRLKVAPPRDAA